MPGTVDLVDGLVRTEYGRIVAVVTGQLGGDLGLAEDVVQDALEAAIEVWPTRPARNPAGWVVATARRRAIDRLRREQNYERKRRQLEHLERIERDQPASSGHGTLADDRLRLVFTCCHPALNEAARVALTLRTLGGLTTTEVAQAFLVSEPTMGQRISRAKAKIRDAGIPYRVPPDDELPERLGGVLSVVYLIFNEGYAATSGAAVVRRDLTAEAIRLGRLLVGLMPDAAEARGLLALMLFQDSRRDARVAPDGSIVLLGDQDRDLWDRAAIAEADELLVTALRQRDVGPYQVQAAIAAVHAEAPDDASTDWCQIVALYDRLHRCTPSAVIRLNQSVAVGMAYGWSRALELIDSVADELENYRHFHSARAHALRALDRPAEALEAYRRARKLSANDADRRFLDARIEALAQPPAP